MIKHWPTSSQLYCPQFTLTVQIWFLSTNILSGSSLWIFHFLIHGHFTFCTQNSPSPTFKSRVSHYKFQTIVNPLKFVFFSLFFSLWGQSSLGEGNWKPWHSTQLQVLCNSSPHRPIYLKENVTEEGKWFPINQSY